MRTYIPRRLHAALANQLSRYPVAALLGPRQCGKSTLAKTFLEKIRNVIILDLERPSDLRALRDPEAFFRLNENSLICIDEIQRLPEIFPVIRYEADRRNKNAQFLILGSASPELLRQSSETLAGRIAYMELTPFLLSEIGTSDSDRTLRRLWLRGGFPRSFLSTNEEESLEWRFNFIRTFLERDIPTLGFSPNRPVIRRLWTMMAHSSGQVVNYSKFAESLGISRNTVKNYIEILEQTFMTRMLQPWHANVKKRLVKSPKIYIRDSGILHALLEIEKDNDLLSHPVFGSSWESFALENILSSLDGRWNAFFYRTEKGNEIDLILQSGRRRICAEFKASSAPDVGRGFWAALEDLKPEETWIVAPVERTYTFDAARKVMVGSPMDMIEGMQGGVFRKG